MHPSLHLCLPPRAASLSISPSFPHSCQHPWTPGTTRTPRTTRQQRDVLGGELGLWAGAAHGAGSRSLSPARAVPTAPGRAHVPGDAERRARAARGQPRLPDRPAGALRPPAWGLPQGAGEWGAGGHPAGAAPPGSRGARTAPPRGSGVTPGDAWGPPTCARGRGEGGSWDLMCHALAAGGAQPDPQFGSGESPVPCAPPHPCPPSSSMLIPSPTISMPNHLYP